jgi:hypothetical protein
MNNVEIYKWLESQKYQTEYEETGEYKMYFSIDMPKILKDYAKLRLSAVIKSLPQCEEIRMKAIELDEKDFEQWMFENFYSSNVL